MIKIPKKRLTEFVLACVRHSEFELRLTRKQSDRLWKKIREFEDNYSISEVRLRVIADSKYVNCLVLYANDEEQYVGLVPRVVEVQQTIVRGKKRWKFIPMK